MIKETNIDYHCGGTMTISFKAYSRQQIKKRGDENIFLNSLTRKDPFSNIIGNKINFPKCVKLHTKWLKRNFKTIREIVCSQYFYNKS